MHVFHSILFGHSSHLLHTMIELYNCSTASSKLLQFLIFHSPLCLSVGCFRCYRTLSQTLCAAALFMESALSKQKLCSSKELHPTSVINILIWYFGCVSVLSGVKYFPLFFDFHIRHLMFLIFTTMFLIFTGVSFHILTF